MQSIDYSVLSASVGPSASPATARSLRHNLAIFRAVHWGAKGVLASDLDFDPRARWWNPPERRFMVAFLSDTWRDWPRDAGQHPALERFCVAMSLSLVSLRRRGAIDLNSVEYDDFGGIAKVFAPVRKWAEGFESPDWADCRPRRYKALSASQALLSFIDRIEREGFSNRNERSLLYTMRWWAVIGARTTDELVERQRFFWLYRLMLCTNNAYVHAGAQYFGPVVGNTSVSVFREVVRSWRDGLTPDQAPLLAHDKDTATDELVDRSHTNIARELWGFLNLHRAPFYNAHADAYRIGSEDPIAATLRIGAATNEWLDAHPEEEEQLSQAFGHWLGLAQRAGKQPLAKVRRFDRTFDSAGNAIDRGAPFDNELNAELDERGSRFLLERLNRRERAMVMLHLALDAVTYGVPDTDESEDLDVADDGSLDGFSYAEPEDSGGFAEDGASDRARDPIRGVGATTNIWIYSPGEQASGFARDCELGVARLYWSGIGSLDDFTSRAELVERTGKSGDSSMLWAFGHRVAVGDLIVARKGTRMIVGLGRVTRTYFHEPTADKTGEDDGPHRLGVEWFWTGSLGLAPDSGPFSMWSFVNGKSRRDELLARVRVAQAESDARPSGSVVITPEPPPPYTIHDALDELFVSEQDLRKWRRVLERRSNLVLCGPPGVGKTFVAKRLAYWMVGARNDEAITSVQFHQAFNYEQFVAGYRPARHSGGGGSQFELVAGPLVCVAEQALADPGEKFVLLIDEINRGNISRILGEAMMLLEHDKRKEAWALDLAYPLERERKFYLPPNLYVIGTMNTADRSLAIVDYALRRRFAFVDLLPQIHSPAFEQHARGKGMPASVLARLRDCMQAINARILADPALGRGFEIGHSFFTLGDEPPWQGEPGDDIEALAHAWLEEVFEFEIQPLLREYWAEDGAQLDAALADLERGRPGK